MQYQQKDFLEKTNCRHSKKPLLYQKILLILLGICLTTVILEIGLRSAGFILDSLREYRNEVSAKQKGVYRIICLGESTTVHGGDKSYPAQLEKILNASDIGIKFSVINKGTAGMTTFDIMQKFKDNLRRYEPNMVIAMMGINDHDNFIQTKDKTRQVEATFFNQYKICKLAKLLWLHTTAKIEQGGQVGYQKSFCLIVK